MNNELKMKISIINMLIKYQNRRKDDMQMHKSAKNEVGKVNAEYDIEHINEMVEYISGLK